MSIKRFFEKCVPLLAVCPFVIGALGYYAAGEELSDALYASFALYFVNPVSDVYNIPIEIARWTAALVTTSAILYAVRRIWTKISQAFCCLGKDSIAVYSDNGINIVFDKSKHNVIYPGREFKPLAKSHIIMLNSDTESLQFYKENLLGMKNKKVYIALKETNYGFIKELPDASNVSFYDIGGAAARTLWKRIALWESAKKRVTVTILGTGHLGQSVLNFGLLLNLYSLDQEITYNFVGSDNSYRILHGDIQTCCSDRVFYWEIDDDKNAEMIENSDITIICGEVSASELQTAAALCKGTLYYYSPSEGGAAEFLDFPAIIPFGKNSEIYTDENIRRNGSTADAMKQHYSYLSRYGSGKISDIQTEWNKLSGFLKMSNISSADFVPIIKILGRSGVDNEELAELEHIRWCRFYYLNFWRYGVPENGENRNDEKKIHTCLRPFHELPESEKEKDRTTVAAALNDPPNC